MPARSEPLRASAGARAKPEKTARSKRKDAISPKVRRLVLERDGYACVCCGRSIIGQRYSLGHRLRASQGGRPVPSNLLTLLGWGGQEHHGRIDNREDAHDEAKGYTVRAGKDPALISVMVSGEDGGLTAWPDDEGHWRDAAGNILPMPRYE